MYKNWNEHYKYVWNKSVKECANRAIWEWKWAMWKEKELIWMQCRNAKSSSVWNVMKVCEE